jgi:hypothetical protein
LLMKASDLAGRAGGHPGMTSASGYNVIVD